MLKPADIVAFFRIILSAGLLFLLPSAGMAHLRTGIWSEPCAWGSRSISTIVWAGEEINSDGGI